MLVVIACGNEGVAGAGSMAAGVVGVGIVRLSGGSIASSLIMSSSGWSGAGGPTSSSIK